MATTAADRDAILHAIQAWPLEDQVLLAHTILEHARAAESATTPGARTSQGPSERSTWDALYGIASGGKQPPSDEQVAQWLDEHKMDKYGR
jgi:hypothetical protein